MRLKYSELITVGEVSLSVHGWADRTGIKAHTIYSRLQYGWSPQRAVTTPIMGHRERGMVTAARRVKKIGETNKQYMRADDCRCPQCQTRRQPATDRVALIARVAAEKGVPVSPNVGQPRGDDDFVRRMEKASAARQREWQERSER